MAKAKRSELAEAEPPAVDPIQMLTEDHRELARMFEQFDRMRHGDDDDMKAALVEQMCATLRIHTELEEEVFYPALRGRIDDEDVLDEALVEHQGATRLVDELESMEPDDELYDAKVKVLAEYVRHHVREEESEMFKKAAASDVDMAQLGREMALMRRELEDEYGLIEDDDEDDEDD